ncbi:Sensory box histidine kinase [Arcticibacter svalbardensis MN12-7]|uniref:histidine kinase n=1 Tax=Arcticibacter svalbardensis MN12-7 TaxID=1150600 RepID=R9GPK7_9SPHI|nr:ATP-binding protein [Arcticibacter svalbardensis]EOR93638.1 Sensory box histidine kinase [Arcticibacter svalbardensis MN12-7]
MKIKNKLRLGFGFLFVVVILFGGLSLYYLREISNNAKVILKDNYESLHYAREMRTVLDETDLPLSDIAINRFNAELQSEFKNITEPGEAEAAANLRKSFESLQSSTLPLKQLQSAQRFARVYLRKIEELNMQAIVRKNNQAQQSVEKATIYLGMIGTVTFLILFSFSINFPGFIANPVNELTEGIREICRKNYKTRLNFKTTREFEEVASAFNQMASRLNEWENSNLAQVISEKLRIETIIEQMQDGIIGLNEKNKVIFINPTAESLLNLNEENIVGSDAFDVAKRNDLLKNLLENKNQDKPIKIYANGKESYFQLESREITIPIYNQNYDNPIIKSEESAGEVYILRNITKFRELDEAKTNFIATISHELKTPIASIKMSLRLLYDNRVGDLNTEQSELLNHIKDDAERLLKITTELLDLAQVETGNIQLNLMAADPKQIVEYAVNAVKFQTEQKRITLGIKVKDNLPKVHADLEKTAWVLVNFLSNAIRYSPENSSIIIEVKSMSNFIQFTVQDSGNGIEEKYLDRLFERYFQVPTDGRNKSGSGLGLAISKDFIEAQKGDIFVESELGTGSKFGFNLPKTA